MKLENTELINEFFEKYKSKYPELSYDQFRDIVFGPWRFLKEQFESGELPVIRLKYFGTFLVYAKKAESELVKLKKRFDEKTIAAKEYFRIKSIIDKFLANERKDKS